MTHNKNNFPYSSEELEKRHIEQFKERYTLESFYKEMEKLKKNIDPRFLEQFELYNKEVSALLSENLSVVASKVVQEELVKQNARIARAFEKDSNRLANQYNRIFS